MLTQIFPGKKGVGYRLARHYKDRIVVYEIVDAVVVRWWETEHLPVFWKPLALSSLKEQLLNQVVELDKRLLAHNLVKQRVTK
jgi:hypothetical protein